MYVKHMGQAISAIIGRELKRMVRQRGRLVSAVVRPLLWLLLIGGGFQSLLTHLGTDAYQQFLVPGLIGMTLLFGSILASLSLVSDHESGVMRMLVIAPFPHYWIVLARTISATLVGLMQALLLLVVLAILGYWSVWSVNIWLPIGMLLTGLVSASSGMLIAVQTRSIENFAVMMNFVIFPMFFLSGALYPLTHLPLWLKTLSLLNPFSYGVDLLKHGMVTEHSTGLLRADLAIGLDIAVLLGFSIIAISYACWRFSQDSVFEGVARLLSEGRKR